jgi:hypothetical protein
MFDIEIYIKDKKIIKTLLSYIKMYMVAPEYKHGKILSEPFINDSVIVFTDSLNQNELDYFIKFIPYLKKYSGNFGDENIMMVVRDLSKNILDKGLYAVNFLEKEYEIIYIGSEYVKR